MKLPCTWMETVSGTERFLSLEISPALGLPVRLLIKSSLGGSRLWALSHETTLWKSQSLPRGGVGVGVTSSAQFTEEP